jgi:hypothetical protein
VRARAAGATAVALCVVALSGCTGSSADTSGEAATRLQAAVSATTAAGTARFTTVSVESVAAMTFPSTTSAGVSSLDGLRSVTTVRLPDNRVGSSCTVDVQLVVVAPTVWFTVPQAARDGLSGSGSSPIARARTETDLTLPAVWRLPDWLASLEHVGNVADAGPSTVAGAATTRFTATLPRQHDSIGFSLGQSVGGAGMARTETVPVQVWVNAEGRVVRIVQSWEVMSEVAGVATDSITIELGDFGTPVAPRPPKAEGWNSSLAGLLEQPPCR